MFKNYFDGEGKVRMIVCVSPRAEDYDESIVSAVLHVYIVTFTYDVMCILLLIVSAVLYIVTLIYDIMCELLLIVCYEVC